MSFLKPKQGQAPNNNLDVVTDIYTPQAQAGATGTNYLQALLTGQGDTAGANAGLENYYQQAGYEPALRQMQQGIVGGGAASGLLRSGSTAKALTKYGAELNQGFYNNYLSQLGNLSNIGNQSGQLLSDVGKGSGYTQKSTGGMIASGIGSIASLFSDRRLKRDIEKIEEMPDGLGIYRFRYIWDGRDCIGVMADEVERLRPWALGPVVAGFQTVNYEAL